MTRLAFRRSIPGRASLRLTGVPAAMLEARRSIRRSPPLEGSSPACGAVTAADRRTVVEKTQISALYAPLRVAVETAGQGASFDAKAAFNARVQATLVQNSSRLIAERVGATPQTLRVVPAYYNLVPTPPGPPPGGPPNGQADILPIFPLTPAAP